MKLYFTEELVKPDRNVVNEAVLGEVQLVSFCALEILCKPHSLTDLFITIFG